jgi:hypothetical protein
MGPYKDCDEAWTDASEEFIRKLNLGEKTANRIIDDIDFMDLAFRRWEDEHDEGTTKDLQW